MTDGIFFHTLRGAQKALYMTEDVLRSSEQTVFTTTAVNTTATKTSVFEIVKKKGSPFFSYLDLSPKSRVRK